MNPATSNKINSLYLDNVLDGQGAVGAWTPALSNMFDIWISGNNAGASITGLDDIIVYADDGGNQPNAAQFPLGAQKIKTIWPNGDVSGGVQFSPNSGVTNYTQVDEQTMDGDTTYVEDGTSGHQDLYDYQALGFTPSAINGVMVNTTVKNPASGTINFKAICKSGATQSDGVSTISPGGYQTFLQEFGVDPNTSAAWTQSNLDAATFGVKVV